MFRKYDWVFWGDNQGWSIDHDGVKTLHVLHEIYSLSCLTLKKSNFLTRTKILHFGSLSVFNDPTKIRRIIFDNIVLTIFHGYKGMSEKTDRKIDLIIKRQSSISWVVVSCEFMKRRLINYGFPKHKIRLIPVGVDSRLYTSFPFNKRAKIRSKLCIPDNVFVIGSFQKDSPGWGDSTDPKLIKGPDIFIKVLEQFKNKSELFVLLTGYSRGYMKKELDRLEIPYRHDILKTPDEIIEYYNIIDCYLVTSREEGGPKAVVEAISIGTPLISTRVGIVPDIEKDFPNEFFYTNIDDVDEISKSLNKVYQNYTFKKNKGLVSSIKYSSELKNRFDWTIVAKDYFEIYRELYEE